MKRHSLYLTFPGSIGSMQAVLAYLSSGNGAGLLLDVIDAAEKAGVGGASELSDAIREAAGKMGGR